MQPIMLARIAHILAFTDVLNEIGSPFVGELKRAGLPTNLVDQPDAYFPVLSALRFFQNMEHKEGIDDFGFQASRQESFDRLSSDFITISQSVPTLYARLQHFSELSPLENTNSRVSFIREGDHFRIFSNLVGYPGLDGLRYSEWIQIMAVVEVIRKSVAPGWYPLEITFQSQFTPCDCAFEQFPNARFLFGQKDTSIKVPVSLMIQPLNEHQRKHNAHKALSSKQQSPAWPGLDFPDSLKLALQSYLREGYPDINLAAEMASTSVRTLQRRLAESGLSYSRLVQQTRFEVAAEMLKDPSVKSFDVACAVGYENSSHFSRAFRRIAGVSPSEYRLQLYKC